MQDDKQIKQIKELFDAASSQSAPMSQETKNVIGEETDKYTGRNVGADMTIREETKAYDREKYMGGKRLEFDKADDKE